MAQQLLTQPNFARAVRLYRQGVAGDAAAVAEADRLLTQIRAEQPGQPLADAYHGAVQILVARDKTKPLEKLRWSKAGLKLLDAAVAADPEHPLIRLLRGKAAYKLPEKYFHRTSTAIEDFTRLLARELQGALELEPDETAQIVYELGDAYFRLGRNRDAELCWRRLQGQTEDSALLDLLRERLGSLEGRPAVEAVPASPGPVSYLIGIAAYSAGTALQRWVDKELELEEELRRKRNKRRRR